MSPVFKPLCIPLAITEHPLDSKRWAVGDKVRILISKKQFAKGSEKFRKLKLISKVLKKYKIRRITFKLNNNWLYNSY
jgi:hypothetical protein